MKSVVSQSEFAKLVHVNRATISRAIEKRTRLNKSIKVVDGKNCIDLVEGILEWHNNADLRKDRGDHNLPESSTPTGNGSEDIKSISDSSKIDSHYSALIRKVLYHT